MQKLTIGRIIHVRCEEESSDEGPRWAAAIIVDGVNEPQGQFEAYVFPTWASKGGVVLLDPRDQDDGEGANIDSWRWPPRD